MVVIKIKILVKLKKKKKFGSDCNIQTEFVHWTFNYFFYFFIIINNYITFYNYV